MATARQSLQRDGLIALIIGSALFIGLVHACSQSDPANEPGNAPTATPEPNPPAPGETYDPIAAAIASVGEVANLEAAVPPMCYTATGGVSNPCWVCHTTPSGRNHLGDWDLQLEYAFSSVALSNHWTNLFADRRDFIASVSDDEILAWVKQDNYQALRDNLTGRDDYPGYVPDLDFDAGFDSEGFAKDGSDWRAIRYHPFLGSFWPTNGSTDDVFIRLPEKFRQDADGNPSRAIYKLNLAILEAAIAGQIAASPNAADRSVLDRAVEPVDERLIAFDLDGDGAITDNVLRIKHLPERYAGKASDHPVRPGLYPKNVEFLHSVRYLDPDQPTFLGARMKELRYSKKVQELDNWAIGLAYEQEFSDKDEGRTPIYRASPMVGLLSDFGWQLQGFIEDKHGRLRLQTEEEHRFCMGCHSAVGITADHTFSFARKVPGSDGWRYHDLRGLQDRPQYGHSDPEILTYFKRVKGADEIRANDEMLARFFTGDRVKETEVRRAALGGDRDLAWLLAPSRARALALNKAYLAIVREQSFTRGRDAVLAPAERVHSKIKNGDTELSRTNMVFTDGRLHLEW